MSTVLTPTNHIVGKKMRIYVDNGTKRLKMTSNVPPHPPTPIAPASGKVVLRNVKLHATRKHGVIHGEVVYDDPSYKWQQLLYIVPSIHSPGGFVTTSASGTQTAIKNCRMLKITTAGLFVRI